MDQIKDKIMSGRINIGNCNKCGKPPTPKDHDHCLGTLPGVMNACCGHGNKELAYIQFLDGFVINGNSACIILEELKKYTKN